MGFYNFTLSISFVFFNFGFWWKGRQDIQVNYLIVLYSLLLLTYLSQYCFLRPASVSCLSHCALLMDQ